MKKLFLTLVLLGATAMAAPAQITPTHRAAALEMVEAANMSATLTESLDTMLKMQLEQSPELKPFETVMRTFFARHMSWSTLRDRYAQLYAESFTEAELRELTTFYRSTLGQKVARTTPQLMGRAAVLGEQAVQPHLPELQQMITAEMQRQGGGGTPKP